MATIYLKLNTGKTFYRDNKSGIELRGNEILPIDAVSRSYTSGIVSALQGNILVLATIGDYYDYLTAIGLNTRNEKVVVRNERITLSQQMVVRRIITEPWVLATIPLHRGDRILISDLTPIISEIPEQYSEFIPNQFNIAEFTDNGWIYIAPFHGLTILNVNNLGVTDGVNSILAYTGDYPSGTWETLSTWTTPAI